jgi:hypothetical protein
MGCLAEIRAWCQHAALDGAAARPVQFKPQFSDINLCSVSSSPHPSDPMNPRVRYWILHWLDVLTWPASLVFKAVRAAAKAARRQINQRA